jgi:excisionase family DNA binding protein
MDTPGTNDKVLTVPEVAKYLSLGTTKTWELVKCGSISSFRAGGRSVRVRRAELERWIEQQERETRERLTPAISSQ